MDFFFTASPSTLPYFQIPGIMRLNCRVKTLGCECMQLDWALKSAVLAKPEKQDKRDC